MYPTYDVTHKNNQTQNFQNKKRIQTRRLSASFKVFFNQQVKNLFSVDMKQENQNCERPTKNKGNKL